MPVLNHVIGLRALFIHKHDNKAPTTFYIDRVSFAELRKELHVGSSFRLDVTADNLKFMGAEVIQVLPYSLEQDTSPSTKSTLHALICLYNGFMWLNKRDLRCLSVLKRWNSA